MKSIPHEMILASAGSGKTFQLTNRYIALLAMQLKSGQTVHPERIIALTFTRKAAGEFFDAILVKLARAATDPKAAAALASDASDPLSPVLATLTGDDFRELLRVFIQRMPRLFLGTLDSFFSNVLRSFPADFGLTTDFEIMDDYRAANAIDEVYERVFSRNQRSAKANDTDQATFLASFRQATIGKEESNVIRSLDSFVENLHALYLGASDRRFWGQAETIWTAENFQWSQEGIDLDSEFDCIATHFASVPEIYAEEWWSTFREEAISHPAGNPFPTRTSGMLGKFLAQIDELRSGHAIITFNRKKHEFDPVASEAAVRITQFLIGGEIAAKLTRTAGVWNLLDLYEKTYAERVRRRGLLTFDDIKLLLAGHDYGDDTSTPVLTQTPDLDDRLRIDYRLDARYDHWLLDEFQDTSFTEWKVIGNLIDEVVQDTSGSRSLFYVGDIKQAIFGWRGGDTKLFTDIFDRYNVNRKQIRERSLDISYRSVSAVLDPVNLVFGDEAALAGLSLPEDAIRQWRWTDHEVASINAEKIGYTTLLNSLAPEEKKSAGNEEIYELVLGVLNEVEPTKHGLSCAVIVRSNNRVAEIVDYLRAHSDIPVVSESKQPIATDNPVNLALLSLFQLSAHPGDRYAWEHLAMTPYHSVIGRDELNPGFLARKIQVELFEDNFETVTRRFVDEIETALGEPFDDFTRSRIESFALAARQYDETGSRDIDDFLSYVSRHTTSEAVDERAVQVLTFHKSKGLTYDMAIQPDLKSDALTTVDLDIDAKVDSDRNIEWVLDLPRKDIVAVDPVLSGYLGEKQAESAYESLCLYYVGMTRARYANYLITPKQAASSKSMNFVRLLNDVLAGEPESVDYDGVNAEQLYQSGGATSARRWFEEVEQETEEALSPDTPKETSAPSRRTRPRRRTPSGSKERTVTAEQIFQRNGNDAREWGNLIHEIFEDIEWFGPATIEALTSKWASHARLAAKAISEVEATIATPDVRAIFTASDSNSVTWRERNFEILLHGEWLSGIFDRVNLERDGDGNVIAASIIDFKTDKVEEADAEQIFAKKYRNQLETYAQVLVHMSGLELGKIRLLLVSTHLKRAFEL